MKTIMRTSIYLPVAAMLLTTALAGAAVAAAQGGGHDCSIGGHLVGDLCPGEVSMAQFPGALR